MKEKTAFVTRAGLETLQLAVEVSRVGRGHYPPPAKMFEKLQRHRVRLFPIRRQDMQRAGYDTMNLRDPPMQQIPRRLDKTPICWMCGARGSGIDDDTLPKGKPRARCADRAACDARAEAAAKRANTLGPAFANPYYPPWRRS